MKFNFFNKKIETLSPKEEWNRLGCQYAAELNELVKFRGKNGWDN